MINLTYKCACMSCDAIVDVPERPPGSDLMLWMGVVTATIAMDHGTRSPRCRSTAMQYVKTPLVDTDVPIGERPVTN